MEIGRQGAGEREEESCNSHFLKCHDIFTKYLACITQKILSLPSSGFQLTREKSACKHPIIIKGSTFITEAKQAW